MGLAPTPLQAAGAVPFLIAWGTDNPREVLPAVSAPAGCTLHEIRARCRPDSLSELQTTLAALGVTKGVQLDPSASSEAEEGLAIVLDTPAGRIELE